METQGKMEIQGKLQEMLMRWHGNSYFLYVIPLRLKVFLAFES